MTNMTVLFKSLVTNYLHWYLGSSFGMFGKKCHICCFLQHLFYGQCWRWDIWLEGPLVWMGTAVLRCLAWTVVQGKWVQQATPHLFSLSRTTFLIVYLHHLETPLIYFAGETCTNPTFSRHLSVLFSLPLWFPWLFAVMNFASVTFNWAQISKQNSAIIINYLPSSHMKTSSSYGSFETDQCFQ